MKDDRLPVLPEALSKWKLVERLGFGTYGKVYLAEPADEDLELDDEELDENVGRAIKILQVPKDESERQYCLRMNDTREKQVAWMREIVDDILEKVRLQEMLNESSHVVKIYDCYVDEDLENLRWTIYITMELLEPLKNYMRRTIFDEKECLKLGIDICNALETMEKYQLIHRDIKPSNILVDREGNFKLADFGTGQMMDMDATMSVKGTPPYTAPEMLHYEHYGPSVDQYSLGITLYCLMNRGYYPLVDVNAGKISRNDIDMAVQRRLMGQPFPGPADASEELGKIICKACAWKPENRYKNISHFKQTLVQYRDGDQVINKLEVEGQEPERKKKSSGKWKYGLIAGLGVICAVVGVTFFSSKMFGDEDLETKQIAEENQEKPQETVSSEQIQPKSKEFSYMTEKEKSICQNALTVDNEFIEYKDTSEWKPLHHQDLRAIAVSEAIGSTYYSNLLFQDIQYSVTETVVYDATIQPAPYLAELETEVIRMAFSRDGGQWTAIDEKELPDYVQESISEDYPKELRNAINAGRDYIIFPGMYRRNYYQKIICMDALAAWKNEDSSVDVLYCLRNGCLYDDVETSYLLELKGDAGVIFCVEGECDLSIDALSSQMYIMHFERGQVQDVEWANVESQAFVYCDFDDEDTYFDTVVQRDDIFQTYFGEIAGFDLDDPDSRIDYMDKVIETDDSTYIDGFNGFHKFGIYEDEEYSVTGIYSCFTQMQRHLGLPNIESKITKFAFRREGDEWIPISMGELPDTVDSAMDKIYYPSELREAIDSGRKNIVYDNICDSWVINDILNMDVLAVWENEDASVDIFCCLRNGRDDKLQAQSYYLKMYGSQGDLYFSKGRCNLQIDNKATQLYTIHLEADEIQDVDWENAKVVIGVYEELEGWLCS